MEKQSISNVAVEFFHKREKIIVFLYGRSISGCCVIIDAVQNACSSLYVLTRFMYKALHAIHVASSGACAERVELYKARRIYKVSPRQRPA